jgi:CBS domain-containing protein
MKVNELMSLRVELAAPGDSIQQAAKVMHRIDAGILPVAEHDRLIGVITDRDIAVRAVAEGKDPKTTLVRDVMSAEVRYCYEDDEVESVAENMAELQVRRLPVVDRDKRLCGLISLADIARERRPREASEALEGISRQGGPHSQQTEVL